VRKFTKKRNLEGIKRVFEERNIIMEAYKNVPIKRPPPRQTFLPLLQKNTQSSK
jgi:hypothetical protein